MRSTSSWAPPACSGGRAPPACSGGQFPSFNPPPQLGMGAPPPSAASAQRGGSVPCSGSATRRGPPQLRDAMTSLGPAQFPSASQQQSYAQQQQGYAQSQQQAYSQSQLQQQQQAYAQQQQQAYAQQQQASAYGQAPAYAQQSTYAQQQQSYLPPPQSQQAYSQQQAASQPQRSYSQPQQQPGAPPVPKGGSVNAPAPPVRKGGSVNAPTLPHSYLPTPARSDGQKRVRALYLNDRQTIGCAQHSHPTPASADREKVLLDAAEGNRSLEYALQILLNVQKLDKGILAKAMLSPKDGVGGLDEMALLQRLVEMGPRVVSSEKRIRKSVKALDVQGTVDLLKDLGLDDQGVQETLCSHTDLSTVHEDIMQVLKEGPPADKLSDAVSAESEKRLRKHLKRRGVTRYSDHILSLRHDNESWASVWQRIWLEYPSRPIAAPLAAGCEHRSEMRVLVIGPGFGLLATPHMIDVVRECGYQLLEMPELPNLENLKDPAQVQQAVQLLEDGIARFQPHVICAASKGGLYFQHLWRDPNWSISCVLINAHPNLKQLPRNASVVVTQGARDETFKRIDERSTILLDTERLRDGVVANVRYAPLRAPGDSPALVLQHSIQVPQIVSGGQIQMKMVPAGAVLKPDATLYGPNMADSSENGFSHIFTVEDLANIKVPASISFRHGREDLEDFARTGAPLKTLLYLSTSGISVRPGKQPSFTRLGDGHAAPESLCKDDTLPRLIDAAVSGKPEDALHESWVMRAPEERRAGETFLGHDPESFRRLWTGQERHGTVGCRCAVTPDSDEFFAIEQIFRSNPGEKTYNFGHDWEGKRIVKIDRVQAPGQLEAIDTYYSSVQQSLETQGTCFVNGVHTRWLFHGSRAIDSIIADPLNGFKTTLSRTTMWGTGSYFARDAQYPDDHGFFGEPRADGTKDMLLCLVVTGMSVLGDESFAIMPYRQGSQHRYNSFVDSISNPEIFVVSNSAAVLPAYVITYE